MYTLMCTLIKTTQRIRHIRRMNTKIRVENLVLKDGDRSKSNACSDYNKIYEDLLLDTNSLIKHMNMKIEEYEASFIIFFSIHEFSIEFFNFM